MIFWNFKNPITFMACVLWNACEYFKINPGRLAPHLFGLATGSKGRRVK